MHCNHSCSPSSTRHPAISPTCSHIHHHDTKTPLSTGLLHSSLFRSLFLAATAEPSSILSYILILQHQPITAKTISPYNLTSSLLYCAITSSHYCPRNALSQHHSLHLPKKSMSMQRHNTTSNPRLHTQELRYDDPGKNEARLGRRSRQSDVT